MRGRRWLLGAALLSPALLGGCGDAPVRRDFPPLHYDYLTRLQLNVADIAYADLPPPGSLDAVSPVPVGPALLQLAKDRLGVGGSSGQAVVTISQARIERSGDGLTGVVALRVDIVAADGTRAGFAEAQVSRQSTGIGRDLRGALYDITKLMLDDMNVELEFQIRRSLRDYLQAVGTAPPPAPVQQQDLSGPAAPATPRPAAF